MINNCILFNVNSAGDVEAGGPIYKGNSAAANEKAPLAKPEDVKVKNKKKADGDVKGEEEETKKPSGLGRKEKSVLQAKLTKLAIQIGYAGNFLTLPSPHVLND